ncbi:MAG: SGNH/GDSL hydrolase family protein [Syntrophomonadaceae bacterium]
MPLLKKMFGHKRILPKDSSPGEPGKAINTEKKSPFYFYIILFSMPFLFFFFTELVLNLAGCGRHYGQWIEAVPGKLMLNPEIARRYFYRNTAYPRPIEDLFYKQKRANSFRVFILGENSAMGFPYLPTSSFSRYLEVRLKAEYPSSKIEVINLSIMAINSFALRDLMPGVLHQKPDLILIYCGHNEYYGALGAASTRCLGRSRPLKNLMLYLERFKTVELMSDIVSYAFRLFRHDTQFGTVSSEITVDQEIPYNSSLFRAGVSQFEGNIRDMLHMARDAGVPVILGTLVCNLKDQPPFISSFADGLPSAEEIFIRALNKLNLNRITEADSLFRFARDLDLLRFRAPEEMNLVIKSLAREFNFSVVKLDSVFNSLSPCGITGNDLMADHLHPNVYGYRMMGELFFEKMKERGIVPKRQTDMAEIQLKIKN